MTLLEILQEGRLLFSSSETIALPTANSPKPLA
jgi:hypothetical protein